MNTWTGKQNSRFKSTSTEAFFSLQNVKLKEFVDHLLHKFESLNEGRLDIQNNEVDSSVYKFGPLVAHYKQYLSKESTVQELESIVSGVYT